MQSKMAILERAKMYSRELMDDRTPGDKSASLRAAIRELQFIVGMNENLLKARLELMESRGEKDKAEEDRWVLEIKEATHEKGTEVEEDAQRTSD